MSKDTNLANHFEIVYCLMILIAIDLQWAVNKNNVYNQIPSKYWKCESAVILTA